MKTLTLLTFAAAVAISLNSCNNSGGGDKGEVTDSGVNNTTSDLNNADAITKETKVEDDGRLFIETAASGGMMEVELGKLAQSRGQNQRVKNFGAMMVKDHSKANAELKTIANDLKVTVPTVIMAQHKQHLDEMSKMSGSAFDKHYMKMMTEDHMKDVDMFQKTASDERKAELKDFAAKTLPVLKMHLDSAKAINSVVN